MKNLSLYFIVFVCGAEVLTPGLNSKLKALVLMVTLLAGTLSISKLPGNDADPTRGLWSVNQSPYGEIRVLDIDNARYLLIDGAVHSMVNVSDLKSLFPYAAVMDITRYFFEKPGKLLLIGLGGGSVAKNFAQNGWDINAVEIDPVVTKIASTYFGVKPSEAKIFQMDGRRFLFTH
jgi:hypothetical protein